MGRACGGHEGPRAAAGPVEAAIDAYEAARAADPDRLEVHWKLLRALHFAGAFAAAADPAAKARFDRARDDAERAFEALRRRARDPDFAGRPSEDVGDAFDAALHADVARVHFWAAIVWGAWSQHHGLLGAVRQGVAGRLHRYARVSMALAPELERGGAQRLLSRLHATLPRVPFLTGWVDRDRALPLAEQAFGIAPAFPGNRLLLALTLLDVAPARRDEALSLLEDVAALEPDPAAVVEELAMRENARERLARERAPAESASRRGSPPRRMAAASDTPGGR